MAKRKKTKPKMTTGEAVQILANESKLMKHQLLGTQQMCRDYFSLFELYITWRGKSEDFLKHVQEVVAEQQKEVEDAQKANEQPDEEDTGVSVTDKKARTERILP